MASSVALNFPGFDGIERSTLGLSSSKRGWQARLVNYPVRVMVSRVAAEKLTEMSRTDNFTISIFANQLDGRKVGILDINPNFFSKVLGKGETIEIVHLKPYDQARDSWLNGMLDERSFHSDSVETPPVQTPNDTIDHFSAEFRTGMYQTNTVESFSEEYVTQDGTMPECLDLDFDVADNNQLKLTLKQIRASSFDPAVHKPRLLLSYRREFDAYLKDFSSYTNADSFRNSLARFTEK